MIDLEARVFEQMQALADKQHQPVAATLAGLAQAWPDQAYLLPEPEVLTEQAQLGPNSFSNHTLAS